MKKFPTIMLLSLVVAAGVAGCAFAQDNMTAPQGDMNNTAVLQSAMPAGSSMPTQGDTGSANADNGTTGSSTGSQQCVKTRCFTPDCMRHHAEGYYMACPDGSTQEIPPEPNQVDQKQ